MEDADDSTTDSQTYSDADRQGSADGLATLMLQFILEDLWISAPDMMDRLVRAGPLHSRNQLLEVFRGRPNWQRAVDRMEVVRAAAACGEVSGIPVTTEVPEHERVGRALPRTDVNMSWWAPQVTGGGDDFPIRMIRLAGGVLR